MKRLLVVCAQKEEAAAIRASGVECRIVQCGAGFRAASQAAVQGLDAGSVDLVISAGTCGALQDRLRLGDVLSPRRILSALGDFEPQALNAPEATLVSQDKVAVSAQDKRALRFQGGDIVDMEAAAVAQVCEARNVPFACLKAVSDLAGEELPLDFNLYRDEAGKFQTTRIAFAGILKIRALLRLNEQNQSAAQALGRALREALA